MPGLEGELGGVLGKSEEVCVRGEEGDQRSGDQRSGSDAGVAKFDGWST